MSLLMLSLLAAQAVPSDRWKLERVEDPITTRATQQLTISGEGGRLVLVCVPGGKRVRFIVASDEFVGNARVQDIRWRFSPGDAGASYWRYGNDFAAEPFKTSDLRAMLSGVASSQAAVFELTRYDHAKVIVRVDLEGTVKGLAAWNDVCGITSLDGLKTDAG